MIRTFICCGFSFVLACGGAVEPAPEDEGTDRDYSSERYLQDIRVTNTDAGACPKAPVAYACETDEAGREWWTLTEECKTTRYACDERPNPVCRTCRDGGR